MQPIRLWQIKAGYEQQTKQQEAYKLIETEKLTSGWKVGQDKIKEKKPKQITWSSS